MERITDYYEMNKEIIWKVGIAAVLTGIFSYYLFIVYGYAYPDGLCEGLYYYHNADWHLACGRWAVRYLNKLVGNNIVMPLIIVCLYSLCIALSVLVLREDWKLKNKSTLLLVTSAMVVTPAVIAHLTYPHVALTFSFAFLLSVFFYFMGHQKHWAWHVLGSCCLCVSMGLYQSYIGAAATLVLLGAVLGLVRGKSWIDTAKELIRFLILGIAGCVLNVIIYKFEIYIRGTYISDRVKAFNITEIFVSLKSSVVNCYSASIEYFTDEILKRQYLYMLFAVVVILLLGILLVKMIRDKKYVEIVLSVVLLLLVPVSMNVIHILIPYNEISMLMRYHYVLIILFGVVIVEQATVYMGKAFKTRIIGVVNIVLFGIVSTCVMSANATFEGLRISYDAIEVQTGLILSDVYDQEGYIPNETPIVFVGFPNDKVSQERLSIYKYAINLTNNPVYWEDMNGLINCRRQYMLNYCGIDPGTFTPEEYYEIIRGEVFTDMPLWPAEGSVKMINGMVVVRLSETPPM